jgi:hypothetical protein
MQPERRTTIVRGKTVYRPVCDFCGSDEHTVYDRMSMSRGWCSHCGSVILLNDQEVYEAREPERLTERVAQLLERGE